VMKVNILHSWQVSVAEAREIQIRLAPLVSRVDEIKSPAYIGGVDISVDKTQGTATAAAVVLSYPGLELVEQSIVTGRLEFPYIPGLLSFREAPLTLSACEQLNIAPDLIMVDGQGLAHPRRFGLACHLGMLLDRPTLGCAKSRLIGEYDPLPEAAGSCSRLTDAREVIGLAVRTREGIKPVYVSIGHRISLEAAKHWVLECRRGYRLPEPCRLAHLAATGRLPVLT
jgi:deoxyribonuclease V